MLLTLVAGGATGLFAVGFFGLSHALLIVPIWSRLAGGVPFGVLSGVALGWAYWEFRSLRAKEPVWRRGLHFGMLTWFTILPATAFGALVRNLGMHSPESVWEPAVVTVLALGSGGAIGYFLEHRLRAAAAGAAAALSLCLAMAGPVPITTSLRAALLFASFLVIIPLCGVLIALFTILLGRVVSPRPGNPM
jgi:hypothetical protein